MCGAVFRGCLLEDSVPLSQADTRLEGCFFLWVLSLLGYRSRMLEC